MLKNLAKIEKITSHTGCQESIKRGVEYYLNHLFDEQKLPKPFSIKPRMVLYKRELYDYAESINIAVLLSDRFPELLDIQKHLLTDLFSRWLQDDGSFRSRKLLIGWNNVQYHRWGLSQLFRSLCLLLSKNDKFKTI